MSRHSPLVLLFLTVVLSQFDCVIDDDFLGYVQHRLSFTLKDDSGTLWPEGDEDFMRVTPYHSPLAEMNYDIQLKKSANSLTLTSIKKDVHKIQLRLWEKSQYSKGVIRYESPTTYDRTSIFCKVREL